MAASAAPTNPVHAWWKEAVIYQVWPASFCDGNGDGWGDLPGIISKLDHIKALGADVLWTSPIYESPQIDMGYDIADYKAIFPKYGTMDDVDRLIAELKKRDMKLMMDLVVNHTSDKHAWFQASKSSKTSPKRDWYIWKPAKIGADGKRAPPNNWSMILGEGKSAWSWDEETQEYYLALFTPEQPDLNWENPEVRAAVHDVMKFWLDKGCCGFRMDVINHISKVQSFPDAPIVAPDHPYQPGHKYFANGPRMNEFLKEINREVLSKYDTITVGESPFVEDEKEVIKMVGAKEEELRMIFIFALVGIDDGAYRMDLKPFGPQDIKRIVNRWQTFMIANDGWNSVFIENHDNPRSVSRYTDDRTPETRDLGCKLVALMQTTLSGTPYVYQGQEIGMKNFPTKWDISEYKDVESQNFWEKSKEMHKGDQAAIDKAKRVLQRKARDHARTPVQWTADKATHGGFSPAGSKAPWMRAYEDDLAECNAELATSNKDPSKMTVFQFWQRGLASRKAHKDAFVYGGFALADDPACLDAFAYLRTATPGSGESDWLVVLNYTGRELTYTPPKQASVKRWVAGNYTPGAPEKPTAGAAVVLRPWEGLLGECA